MELAGVGVGVGHPSKELDDTQQSSSHSDNNITKMEPPHAELLPLVWNDRSIHKNLSKVQWPTKTNNGVKVDSLQFQKRMSDNGQFPLVHCWCIVSVCAQHTDVHSLCQLTQTVCNLLSVETTESVVWNFLEIEPDGANCGKVNEKIVSAWVQPRFHAQSVKKAQSDQVEIGLIRPLLRAFASWE